MPKRQTCVVQRTLQPTCIAVAEESMLVSVKFDLRRISRLPAWGKYAMFSMVVCVLQASSIYFGESRCHLCAFLRLVTEIMVGRKPYACSSRRNVESSGSSSDTRKKNGYSSKSRGGRNKNHRLCKSCGRVFCRLATPSGNRTRVSPVAGAYSTTRPTVSEAVNPPSVRCLTSSRIGIYMRCKCSPAQICSTACFRINHRRPPHALQATSTRLST